MAWFRGAIGASVCAFLVLTGGTIRDSRTVAAGTLLGLLTIFVVHYIRSPWRKLPPSPRRLPILGNSLQLMDKKWLFSRDCKERFGKSMIIQG
jgi:hypothetical protein